ncbi:MAG: SufD family Fe-S cluster assembly protein [Oscillospiraceae bacterium]|jgi:Fe-S cluster assembly scaffold protein SufB|nr:SufD family Fe-S cluster assembly protein [Oscillospiraceae bacterium]MDY4191922.1 SufD family Fe-S cluster assembly protein [Oscillospiraceae bacterium]
MSLKPSNEFSVKKPSIVQKMLKTIADLPGIPTGAYNIRVDGESAGRQSTENIEIRPKPYGRGIEIYVQPGTRGEFVHIPVVVDESGLSDMVYNDFYIGEGADVDIIAGCGIHNDGTHLSQHDGIHTFYVGKDARVRYVEKHYGEGSGTGERVLNPVTVVHLDEGSCLEMETVQIEGVDSTKRTTKADLKDGAQLIIREKLMTSGTQQATTEFEVELNGENCSADVVSRSVAKGNSFQAFYSRINGNNACAGHSECDAIIMDSACVKAVPEITANHVSASLIHEAAIGKIAGEQITKLMTLGLSQEDAEKEIVRGFLK